MAKAATTDNVNKSRQAPDARFAVQQIRFSIEKRKGKISSINGEIADDWKKLEAKGVNKAGARIWGIFDKMEQDERVDAFRTLNAMADVSEWPEQAEDLVDQAEGKVVPMRRPVKDGVDPDPDDANGELDELENEDGKPALKKPSFGDGSIKPVDEFDAADPKLKKNPDVND